MQGMWETETDNDFIGNSEVMAMTEKEEDDIMPITVDEFFQA